MEWLTTNLPSQPIKVKINTKEAGIELKWEDVTPENTAYYVIYRVEGEEVPSINDAKIFWHSLGNLMVFNRLTWI